MSPLAFLAIAVVLSLLGCAVLWLRHRTPKTYDSGIREFQREMRALRPQGRDEAPSTRRRKGGR